MEKIPRTRLGESFKKMKEAERNARYAGAKPVPKINPFSDMIEQYMRTNNISKKDLAKIIGCTQQNINYKLRRPAGDWNARDIITVAKALGIDLLYAQQICTDAVTMSEEYTNRWKSA